MKHIGLLSTIVLTNLYLTLLDKLGIAAEKFPDATGELNLLPVT